MNNLFPTRYACLTLGLLATSLLVAGCGSSPEKRAKEMADLNCDCFKKSNDLSYEADVQYAKELNGGTFKTQIQASRRFEELKQPLTKLNRECEAKLEELQKKVNLDFPREEDRQTIANALSTQVEQCSDSERKKYDARREENKEALTENRELLQKLPSE